MYECPCGKIFKTHGGLWKHKQRCAGESCIVVPEKNTIISHEPADPSDKETIMMLVKQNQEFKDLIITQKNQIVEMSKEVAKGNVSNHYTQGNNNITQTNSNNKTFNLQFFLNETCKDAMNITDFIKSLQLNLQDLEQVGELGYAEGKGYFDFDATSASALDWFYHLTGGVTHTDFFAIRPTDYSKANEGEDFEDIW